MSVASKLMVNLESEFGSSTPDECAELAARLLDFVLGGPDDPIATFLRSVSEDTLNEISIKSTKLFNGEDI